MALGSFNDLAHLVSLPSQLVRHWATLIVTSPEVGGYPKGRVYGWTQMLTSESSRRRSMGL